MSNKNKPSVTELICNKLNQRGYQDTDLFSEKQSPCYWRLSDLVNLYPDLLDITKPISQSQIHQMEYQILNTIPKFKDITPKPIHVLSIKENYVLRDQTNNLMKTVKNGTNQYITRVACEYLFSQLNNKETEQAYFLSPNKTIEEISNVAKEVKFEHIRNQISGLTNTLASYTKQANPRNPNRYKEIWGIIWQNFYNVQNTNTLKQSYNIRTSPIDYMTDESLRIMNRMLQTIISRYQNCMYHNIYNLEDIARNVAISARAYFTTHGTTPEQHLTTINSHPRLTKIQKLREKFWLQYYPETLQR